MLQNIFIGIKGDDPVQVTSDGFTHLSLYSLTVLFLYPRRHSSFVHFLSLKCFFTDKHNHTDIIYCFFIQHYYM